MSIDFLIRQIFQSYKFVDWEVEGQMVKLYFTTTPKDAWGDDWNDAPYEDNAGRIYDEYLEAVLTLYIPTNYEVWEFKNDYYDRGHWYSKKQLIEEKKTVIKILDLTTPEEKPYKKFTLQEDLATILVRIPSEWFYTLSIINKGQLPTYVADNRWRLA